MNAKLLLFAFISLLLVGCKEHELYSQLTEQEANEMVALMYSADLVVSKRADKGNTFSVLTDQASFSNAMRLLQANGLPRERFQSLGDVFKKEGFVSSPLEERARLNHALSQEISHTLSSIDGVLMARVHLAVPEKNQLAGDISPSSASVMVKHRADVDLKESVAKIKALVVDGVENLPYENVTVALFAAQSYTVPEASQLPYMKTPGSVRIARMQVIGPVGLALLGLLLIVSGLIWWFRLGRISNTSASMAGNPTKSSTAGDLPASGEQ